MAPFNVLVVAQPSLTGAKGAFLGFQPLAKYKALSPAQGETVAQSRSGTFSTVLFPPLSSFLGSQMYLFEMACSLEIPK